MSMLIFLLFLLPLTFSEDITENEKKHLKDYCSKHNPKNPNLPFTDYYKSHPVPYDIGLTNLEPGQTLIVKGSTPEESKNFTIDLQSKSANSSGDDIPLHISVRFDEGKIVLNTFKNGSWDKEERQPCPIKKGEPFDIRIRVHDDGFQVMINQWELTYYEDRLPISSITNLSIFGNVCLDYVDRVGKYYDVPFERNITDGFQVVPILLSGIVDENAERFHINILKKNGDIALHFNPRFDEDAVVRNSFLSKVWGKEEREGKMPFEKGVGFDLAIRNKHEGFQVFVNGELFVKYAHRVDPNDINGLQIEGDIDLYYIKTP